MIRDVSNVKIFFLIVKNVISSMEMYLILNARNAQMDITSILIRNAQNVNINILEELIVIHALLIYQIQKLKIVIVVQDIF